MINKQQVAVFKQTFLKISWVENGVFVTYDKESNMVDYEGSLLVNACKTSSVKFLQFKEVNNAITT